MNRIRFPKAHLIYWCISIPLSFFAYTFPHFNPDKELKYQLVYWIGVIPNYAINIAEFYLYYKIIVPKNLLEKFSPYKYISISFLIMISGAFLRIIIWNRMPLLHGEIPYETIQGHVFALIQNATTYSTMPIFISLVEVWILSEIEKSKLKNLTTDSRINFLKSQINPHFIFNTLNNIYSLSLKSRAKTKIALSKLQSTFNHLKKVENSATVTIEDTEEYISSYIKLSKMRLKYPEKVKYEFEILEPKNEIYPMLLIPFIENAFKHSNLVKKDDFISIYIVCDQKGIEVEVKNTVPIHVLNKDSHSGIGIENVRERLNLLFHENEYKVSASMTGNNEYISTLKMPYAKF